jgi:hypothetical protein
VLDLFQNNGAIFDGNGSTEVYRYQLWRIWDEAKDLITFVGLNPSTANANQDDPTIRRVTRFARSWGYGGVYMVNLFAFVSTDPKVLLNGQREKIGSKNDAAIADAAAKSKKIIFAWGSFQTNGRAQEVIERYPDAEALIINADGSPRHPLYVPGKVKPVPFRPRTRLQGVRLFLNGKDIGPVKEVTLPILTQNTNE